MATGTAVTLVVRAATGAELAAGGGGASATGAPTEVPAIGARDVNAYVRAIASVGLVPNVVRTISRSRWARARDEARRAAGDATFGEDPRTWGEWIASVEQYRGRYQTRLAEAQALLATAAPPVAPFAVGLAVGAPPSSSARSRRPRRPCSRTRTSCCRRSAGRTSRPGASTRA